jgi:hypothetical protein
MAAVSAAATLSLFAVASASGDIITNDLDAVYETMNLTLPGSSGTTKLYVIVEGVTGGGGGKPVEHPNCDLQGAANKVTLVAHYDESIVDVALSDDGVLAECDDKVTVTVTPVGVGSTTVSFTGIEKTSQDRNLNLTYDQAAFNVDVTGATGGDSGGSRCDNDRAAPAWARAFLKANDQKAKVKGEPNYVAQVARKMGPGTMFGTTYKVEHPAYEKAVYDYMTSTANGLGLSLPKGPDDVRKPGERCTPLPTN